MESLDFVSGYVKRRSCPDASLQIPPGHQFGRQPSPRLQSLNHPELPILEEDGKRSGSLDRGSPKLKTASPMSVRAPNKHLERAKSSGVSGSMLKRLSIDDNSAVSQYKFLGSSGLKVSNVCLSSMSFGTFPGGPATNTNEASSHAILDKFLEMGGNFIDTADTYPGMGTHSGYSESIIGRWLSSRDRHRVIIGSKCRYVTDPSCPNGCGLSRNHILWSLDQSLKRLKTDYIDLYQIHGWDAGTPIEDTLRTLNDLVRGGKVRHIGAANLAAWQLQKFCSYAKFMGLEKFVTVQMNYSVADRGIEHEVFDVCREENVGLLCWNPLKDGILASRNNEAGADTSKPLAIDLERSERISRITALIESIAETNGKSMAQVALRWLIDQDSVTSVIVSATSQNELAPLMEASRGKWRLSAEEMSLLEAASRPEVTSYPLTMTTQQTGRRRRRFNVI